MEVLNADIGSFLENEARKAGRSDMLYGFADIKNITSMRIDGASLDGAISVACALEPSSISSLKSGPTASYFEEYVSVSEFLTELSSSLVAYLADKGYQALALEESLLEVEPFVDLRTTDILPTSEVSIHGLHRVFAAHAGLGWIGKSGLVVTKHYGSAVLLCTVFTNAPLDCATEVFLSRCGRCSECSQACPVDAINISDRGIPSDLNDLLNADACANECHKQTLEKLGSPAELCGICIYACPYTKSYLSRKGFSYE